MCNVDILKPLTLSMSSLTYEWYAEVIYIHAKKKKACLILMVIVEMAIKNCVQEALAHYKKCYKV